MSKRSLPPKPDNTKGTTTRDVNAAQRVKTALQMRAQGKSYDDIAVACSYGSRGAAHHAVQRELQRVVVEDVQELRREQLLKLRMLEEECWSVLTDKSEKGRMFSVERILSIQERISKLMGLDKRPDEQLANQPYEKRIVLIDEPQEVKA